MTLSFRLLLPLAIAVVAAGAAGEPEPVPAARVAVAEPKTELIRGRIVWLGEALKRRYGIESDPDAMKSAIALETTTGELVPIVKDARGRGFHLDPRLHRFDYELAVRRIAGAPSAQVIRVYTLHDGRKYEFDYWCDICAIPMFELKECECCQGPIRFRERLMGPDGPGAERNPGVAR